MQLTRSHDCAKMERLRGDTFIVEFYHALYRTCVATSMLNILPAFIEANMWHYTDPSTTGFSLFAALTFVCFLCLSSFLFLCKRVREWSPGEWTATGLSLIEPILLLTAASPMLYDSPKARSLTLGVGVLLLPLVYTFVMCNARCSPVVRLSKACCQELCPLPSATPISEKTKVQFEPSRPRVEFKPGTELLLASYLTLSLRWCAGSINLFYATWEAPLVLLICTLLVALPKLVCRFHEGADDAKSRATSRSTERSSILSRDVEASPVAATENRSDVVVDHAADATANGQTHSTLLVSTSNGWHSKTTASAPDGIRFKTGHRVLVRICAIVDGVSKGFLFNLFLWLFTSPAILRLWSGMEGNNFGIIILVCFAVGTVVTSACSWCMEWSSKYRVYKGMALRICLAATLFVATGFQLTGENSSLSFLGSCLFSISLPQALVINLGTSAKIVRLSDNCSSLRFVPGFIAVTTSVAFVVAQLALSLFVNPNLSKMLLGRMDLILYNEIVWIAIGALTCMAVDWLYETKIQRPTPVVRSSSDLSCRRKLINACVAHKKCVVTALIVALIACTTIPAGPGWQLGHCVGRHGHSLDAVSAFFNESARGPPSSFSVMSWNVLFGHDMKGNENLPCLARVIQASRPDVFALQESDALPVFWGGKDILGYLQHAMQGMKAYYGIEPLKSSLGVGLLTRMKVLSHEKFILPCDRDAKLPHYSMTKTAIDVASMRNCSEVRCDNASDTLYVFNIHAVFKNWTKSSAPISKLHMEFLAEQVRQVDVRSPVLAMGDFNLNPFESELDILHNDLGLKSALHPHRTMLPVSSLLNRYAVVDHIFYRGLTLLRNRTVTETGTISDHRPVFATFDLQT